MSTRHTSNVVILQTLIPDYRERFYLLLSERLGSRLLVVAGRDDFALGLAHSDRIPTTRTRNHYLFGRRILWQSGALRPVLQADVAVLVLNPRMTMSWIGLVLRKLMRRRTVLWGHAWPRRGRASRSDMLRHIQRRLADSLVVYTQSQASELRELMPHAEVVAAPNALYRKNEMVPLQPNGLLRDFLCVGRLVAEKKPQLLLDAFALAAPRLAPEIRLVFVGDGPLRESLEKTALSGGVQDRVDFAGHVSDVDSLRALYADAIASVSPGYVGLSLIQSIGFGVPMLAARDEPHSPEVEAASDGVNAVFFASDSAPALAAALAEVAQQRGRWLACRETIAARARETYSIEVMVDAFLAALHVEDSEPTRAPASPEENGPSPGYLET